MADSHGRHTAEGQRHVAERLQRLARGGVILALRLPLAAVLLYAGSVKIQDPRGFAQEIAGYQFLPELAPLAASTLPATELLLGILLLLLVRGRWLGAAALASATVFAVFTAAIAQVLIRGIDTSCGCFGGASGAVDNLVFLRAVLLLGLSLTLFFLTERAAATAAGQGP